MLFPPENEIMNFLCLSKYIKTYIWVIMSGIQSINGKNFRACWMAQVQREDEYFKCIFMSTVYFC